MSPVVDNTPSDACSICGENFRKCKHPWDKPFDKWPTHLNADLPSTPSAEGSKD